MAPDAERQSLSAAIGRLLLAAPVVSLVVTSAVMASRGEWLTYVVVASGRIEHNVRVDAEHLEYQLRWMKRELRPIERMQDAAGKFLTRSAAARCRQNSCTELPLFETDLADRPEVYGDGEKEIFKASLGEPWRVGDINIGDHVYAIPAAGSAVTRQQTSDASRDSGVVVPNAGNDRERNVAAPPGDSANAPSAQPIVTTEMIVVGIAAGDGNNPTYAAFLVPATQTDLSQLLQLRARGVRVTSRIARERIPVEQQERSKSP
jgi:hypothetical protein